MMVFMKDLFDKCFKKSADEKKHANYPVCEFKTNFHIDLHESKIFSDLTL